ncbi:MAG: cytochrome P450, partial [Mycobacterium sp.]
HTTLRRLVAAAFTPKQMRRIDEMIQRNARDAVTNLLEKAQSNGGQADFVAERAELMPMNNINDMMDVPDGDREEAANQTAIAMSWSDPEMVGHTKDEVITSLMAANGYCHELAVRLAGERRENPGNDLISSMAQAEIDGERLTDHEIGAFFVLLTVAGNDTTRQTTSHALKALTDFPDQRVWLLQDFDNRIGTAVEEFIRFATPVMTFRRTAATDYELGTQTIRASEKLAMFYASGNWDDAVFDHPDRFDLSRDPNPHLGFGGGGQHYCLGTHVARAQLRAIFGELLRQLPDIGAGDPEYLAGNFIHGIRSMPCTF